MVKQESPPARNARAVPTVRYPNHGLSCPGGGGGGGVNSSFPGPGGTSSCLVLDEGGGGTTSSPGWGDMPSCEWTRGPAGVLWD